MMKKYIKIGIVILVGLLAVSTYTLYKRNQNLKEEISVSMSNQKVFITENSSIKEENRVFKLTVEQLNYYNDSILQKMNEVRKELKIKDGNNAEIFQAVNATAVEFDTYQEAKILYYKFLNLIYYEQENKQSKTSNS